MKKVYINRMPIFSPWGGGALFVNAAYEHLTGFGHQVIEATDLKTMPDVILLAGLTNDGQGVSAEQAVMYKMFMSSQGHDIKLVLRVNENDARKGTKNVDNELIELSKHVDGTVWVSSWLQEYFSEKGWYCTNNITIKNGVNKDIFKPGEKLANGKINLVTHHWSNNELKGFDIYEEIDRWLETPVGQGFTFTYIGRDRNTFKNTKVITPLVGKKLGEELGKYDVYVSASRFDPGPNHILESLSCELPTFVHDDGGGCVEFTNNTGVYDSFDKLKHCLVNRIFPDVKNVQQIDDWKTCIASYSKFIEAI